MHCQGKEHSKLRELLNLEARCAWNFGGSVKRSRCLERVKERESSKQGKGGGRG
jgi:hypothetical protein